MIKETISQKVEGMVEDLALLPQMHKIAEIVDKHMEIKNIKCETFLFDEVTENGNDYVSTITYLVEDLDLKLNEIDFEHIEFKDGCTVEEFKEEFKPIKSKTIDAIDIFIYKENSEIVVSAISPVIFLNRNLKLKTGFYNLYTTSAKINR